MGGDSVAQKQPVLALFPEVVSATKKLSDAQFGRLIRAAFAYRFDGFLYSGEDPAVDLAFSFVASQIDRYKEVSEKRRKAAQERWDAQKSENDNPADANGCKSVQKTQADAPIHSHPVHSHPVPSNPSGSAASLPPHTPFVPPSVDMVREYCESAGLNHINPQKFVDHYTANGWHRGKVQVKDWQALARIWNDEDAHANTVPAQPRDSSLDDIF